METHIKIRVIAGILLIISGITHNLQLFFYGTALNQILAALYGVIYFVLGVLLIKYQKNQILAILGGTVTILGGILGTFRLYEYFILVSGQLNFFIIFHLIVDIIVIPMCWYVYIMEKKSLQNNST